MTFDLIIEINLIKFFCGLLLFGVLLTKREMFQLPMVAPVPKSH